MAATVNRSPTFSWLSSPAVSGSSLNFKLVRALAILVVVAAVPPPTMASVISSSAVYFVADAPVPTVNSKVTTSPGAMSLPPVPVVPSNSFSNLMPALPLTPA